MPAQKNEVPRPQRFSYLGYLGIISFGLTLTFVFFWQEKNTEQAKFQVQFERDASFRANLSESHLNGCLQLVKAMHSYYASTDNVELNKFKAFMDALLANRKELQVMGWLPRITHAERKDYEERMRRNGYENFVIVDFVTEQTTVVAPEHEEYFPIEYIEPSVGNETKVGLNILSQPIRRATLERARDTGMPAVTGLINIYSDKVPGFNIYAPNYRKGMPISTVEERRAALDGYQMGVFRMADAISKPFLMTEPIGMPFDLIDRSAPPERNLLYHWEARLQSEPSWLMSFFPQPPKYVKQFDFCGSCWELSLTPNETYIRNHYNLNYWLILPVGAGLTLLLYFNLRGILNRGEILEGEVLERTAELCQYRDNLEKLVGERAAELRRTNERLIQEVAVRKSAETRLQDSETRLRSILDSTAEAIYGVDKEGHCVFCNRACIELLGYMKQEELLGQNMHWLIHHSHADGTPYPIDECKIFQSYRQGTGAHLDDEVLWRSNGTCIPVEYWSYPQIIDGKVVGTVVAFVDISKRKKAQESLRLSEERLRAIYEGSVDAILLLTEKGFFDCNPAAVKMFGFERKAELMGLHPAEVSPPKQPNGQDTMQFALERMHNALHQGSDHFEVVHRRKDGSDFPAEVLLSAFEYGGRKVLQATVRDITPRKKAESELSKLSIAVEQNPATIVITDRMGNIEYVNPKFTQATGYSAQEAIGKNPRILKSGLKNTREDYKNLWDTILSGREWRGTFHNKKKNGELFWEQALISPIKDDLGRITHFVAIKEDITQRIADEEKLKIVLEDLETSNEELTKASQIKSLFLATMSHEIRTPLNAIIGMTGLLLDAQLDAEQRDHVETVRISAEMLLDLINNILDFSKIEAEKVELEKQPFDLRRCIRDSIDLLAAKAKSKNIAMVCEVQALLPDVFEGDVTRLRQVLVNLLSNAVKFTEAGEIVTSVTGKPIENNRFRLHFQIKDTGLGIPPDVQKNLFQPFSQGDASTHRRFGGTGLGLAICQRLCEMMGGVIWVESEGVPGKGATFHFTITASPDSRIRATDAPIIRSDYAVDGNDFAQRDLIAASRNDIKPENVRVLLAEDNLINTKVALKILAKLGYRADVVSNGFEVLAAIDKIPYDVILMDCQMPELDGYEATAQIRAREAVENRKHIHIIAMTAYALKGDQEKCLAAGMDDYLSKPVRELELQKALGKYGKADDSQTIKAEPLAARTAILDDARQAVALAEPKAETTSAATKEAAEVESKPQPKIPESMRAFMPYFDAPPARQTPAEFTDDVENNLLDWETLWELEDASLNDFVQLIELFRQQSKEQMALLNYAIGAGKAEEINQLAHKLAGSCSACGLKAVVAPLKSLEGKGKEGQLEKVDELLTEIDWLLKLSQSALDEYVFALQRNTHS